MEMIDTKWIFSVIGAFILFLIAFILKQTSHA
jgi:hypothetical protein